MTDATLFSSTSPRFGLPFLFAGQAQKEVFVNEAHALVDALLHCAIEGTATTPPAAPGNGMAWLVNSGATAEWAGHDGEIACRQSDNWLFVRPRAGMRMLDRSSGQYRSFDDSWNNPQSPPEPTGGSVVDSQARAAIAELIAALRTAGIFPAD